MSCWETLGLEPTSNRRAIKRAYAAALALHHPEDDPAGAQCVQDAYEQALTYARGDGDAECVCTPDADQCDFEPVAAAAVDSAEDDFGTVPAYVAAERRRREQAALEAGAWLEAHEGLASDDGAASAVLADGTLIPPSAYWDVEGFDERFARLLVSIVERCDDLNALEAFAKKFASSDAVETRRVCTERISALRARRARRKMLVRAAVLLLLIGVAFAAFIGRGLLDADDQAAVLERGEAIQAQADLGKEMIDESQRRYEENEAVERALLDHREENDAVICQKLYEQIGLTFTMETSALDATFPPMDGAPGRAVCSALASDGTVYTALVEYGADGVVTELVLAEPA